MLEYHKSAVMKTECFLDIYLKKQKSIVHALDDDR
jgi:hypothetical protein